VGLNKTRARGNAARQRGSGTLGGTIVKTKKTMSREAIAANRANAHKSTGPRSINGKIVVGRNAQKHGLLAKRLTFRDAEEQAEFMNLMEEVQNGLESPTVFERLLAEDVAIACWKLRHVNVWELEEIQDGRKAAKSLVMAVARNSDGQFPLFASRTDSQSGALGWDCQDVVIRSGSANSEAEGDPRDGEKTGNTKQLEIVARLATSMDTILRYETAIKRDLYRAIGALREMRRERVFEALTIGDAQ
jgi:hypothetical protein